MKDTLVRARIDERLKAQAVEILARNGLEMSDAIRLFLTQVVRRGGLPFTVRDRSARVPAKPRRSSSLLGRRSESRLARTLDLELLNEARVLSPADRLAAFVSHCRQMAKLQSAGETRRASAT